MRTRWLWRVDNAPINHSTLHKPSDSLQIRGKLIGWLLHSHTSSSTLKIAVQNEMACSGGTGAMGIMRTVVHYWLVP